MPTYAVKYRELHEMEVYYTVEAQNEEEARKKADAYEGDEDAQFAGIYERDFKSIEEV